MLSKCEEKSYNFTIELSFLGKCKKIYNKYLTDKIRISCNLNLAAHSAPTFTFGELSIDGNAAAMKSFLFAFQTFAKRQLCMDNFFLRTRAEWCPTLWILPDISATAMLTRTIIYSARLREVRKTWDNNFIKSRFWLLMVANPAWLRNNLEKGLRAVYMIVQVPNLVFFGSWLLCVSCFNVFLLVCFA